MLRKVASTLLLFWNTALAILLIVLLWKGGYRWFDAPYIDYKDFVTILLTSIAIMIAIAALFVGAAAVWTYKEGMEIIRTTADKAAREVAASVATRVARETPPAETGPSMADAIAQAVATDEEGSNGQQ